MGIRVLGYRIGLFALLREIQYSLSQLRQEPLADAYVPTFQALRDEWKTVLLDEISILDDLSYAQAVVDKADRALDDFAGRVSQAIDEHTDGKTRKQVRTALFKNKTRSKFCRPVLSGQLVEMGDWHDTLTRCGVPKLVAMADEAAKLVEAGEKAKELKEKAQQKNRDFREVGARKQFIDKVNAERKDAHGGLGKIAFKNPALAQDFPEGFFHREPPRDEEETIDEVKTSIDDLTARLEARKALLKRLEDEAAAEAKAEEERKAQEQAAEALEKQAEELLEQAKALRKKQKK